MGSQIFDAALRENPLSVSQENLMSVIMRSHFDSLQVLQYSSERSHLKRNGWVPFSANKKDAFYYFEST